MQKASIAWLAVIIAIMTEALFMTQARVITKKRDPNRAMGRTEMLETLAGDTVEERLHLERCHMSSNGESCIMATDGEINIEPWSTECAITLADERPFFEARLEDPSYVTKVTLYVIKNINERGKDALLEFEMFAGEHVCVDYRSYSSFMNKTFACDTFADSIRVQSHLEHATLALCEVAVYGKVARLTRDASDHDAKLTGKKLTIKDSIASSVDGRNYSINAHDGNRNQYTSTGACYVSEPKPMDKQARVNDHFEALLQLPALIRKVVIYNSVDRTQIALTNFEIAVNGQLCYRHDSITTFSVKEFKCNRFGQRVRITKQYAGLFVLCEVEIYGFEVDFAAPHTYKYVGCYREKRHNRDMQYLAAVNHMTTQKCEHICRRRKKPYFGLQQGKQCWCSERYGVYGRAAEDSCWMHCAGYQAGRENCGARMRNSVYEIGEYASAEL